MEEMRNEHTIFVGKSAGDRSLLKPSHRLEDDIKIYNIIWRNVEWIYVTGEVLMLAFVQLLMNIGCLHQLSRLVINVSKRPLLDVDAKLSQTHENTLFREKVSLLITENIS
jgi:hypothetical protein